MNGPSTAKEAKRPSQNDRLPTKTTTHLPVIPAKPGPHSDTGAGTQGWGRVAGFPPRAGETRPPAGAGLFPAHPLRFSVREREQAKRCERGMQGTRGQTHSPSLILQTTTTPTRNEPNQKRERTP